MVRRTSIFQFSRHVIVDLNTILAALIPLLEDRGELFDRDSICDPCPLQPEVVQVQAVDCQLTVHMAKQEEVQ
jgi:hypothetical protein